MNRTILTVAGALSASSLLLVDSAVKGTALLALAAVAAMILRRDSAATRHLVWLLAIVAMLVVPLLSAMLPQWRVLPAWANHSPKPAVVDVTQPSIAVPSSGVIELPQIAVPVEVERPSETVDRSFAALPDSRVAIPPSPIISESMAWSWTWIKALPLVWAIGFSVLILRLSAARWMLWNSERLATVVCRRVAPQLAFASRSDSATAQDPIVMALEAICSQLGIGRPVTLLIHPDKTIPVVWGILRCRLLLPATARQWSDEQLRSVLLHELAHVKRCDATAQLLTQIACALHWFNPLVWFAAWRLDVERERACDDLVLASGVRPSAYAGHLLDVVTGLSPTRWTQTCGLAMARQSSLESRLAAVLGKNLNRRGVSVALAGIGLVIAAGIAVPIAMLCAADDKWKPPQAAHIGTNDVSAYCVHDGQDTSFLIVYHGFTDLSSANDSNPKTRTWTDSGTLTAKKPGIALNFYRTHTAPGTLSITTAPADARDLSQPAPPPREFGHKEYDLTKGRVFLLSDNGAVRQLDIAVPVVTELASAKELAARTAAIPPQETKPDMQNQAPLTPETEAQLDWGEAVNGLRAAVIIRAPKPDAARGIFLAVQNVSDAALRFSDSLAATKPRKLYLSDTAGILMSITSGEPTNTDSLLAPREVLFLPMFPTSQEKEGEAALIEGLRKDSLQTWRAVLEIKSAPEGGWKGKLTTADTRCTGIEGPQPKTKEGRALFKSWQDSARLNGDIPGGLLVGLHGKVTEFIRNNEPDASGAPFAAKMKPLEPRFGEIHDWKPADVVALLDDIAAVTTVPLETAMNHLTQHGLLHGHPLPAALEKADWGEPLTGGLRMAYLLEPRAAEYPLGSEVKARIILHNSGRQPVAFIVGGFHQPGHKAKRADGSELKFDTTDWLTRSVPQAYRLAHGECIELNTPGLGIGAHEKDRDDWSEVRAGSWVLCGVGDEVTFLPGGIMLSRDDTTLDGEPRPWWPEFITERLNREAPVPLDRKEREYLLYRVVRDLFGTAPSTTEGDAFAADKSSDALKNLATLLAKHPYGKQSQGFVQPGETKFRVLPPDPDAAKKLRVAMNPGRYKLGDEVRLVVTRRRQGARIINEGSITHFAPGKDNIPHDLKLPEGYDTWAAGWEPGTTVLWVAQKGLLRSVNFADPAALKMTRYEGDQAATAPIPAAFRAVIGAALTVPDGPKQIHNSQPPATLAPATLAPAAELPTPKHKDARAYYEVWQRYARASGDIPGALVGELATAVKTFIGYNPTWETVPQLNELLPRLDATHDWKPADAIALLDEVAAVKDSPLSMAMRRGTRHTIRNGEALPKRFADAPWSEAQPNGLRAAWVLEPSAAEHRIGAALRARLLVQNSGQVPVMLQVPTWHQGEVKASDAKGAEVEVSGISWTTMAQLVPVRLGPRETIEIYTPGVGFGPRAGMGPWAGPRVGSNVLAKPGDELTLAHSLVPLDGTEVGISEDDPHVIGPGWWLAHIKVRLSRELPLPADAAERKRLLDRAVRELFAAAPTAEETAAFVADKTPEALDALAKRLAAREDVVSFSGKLPTAPAKFRMLAADANSDKQLRVVLGPGEYPLPSTTATRGDATLKIVGRPVGDRRTNDAQLLFEATEATGARPPAPHKLEVPDGWGTWAIVCRPNEGFFYLLHKGTVRKIDYSKREVTDTPANDLPDEFRDEVKRILDIHEISEEQQSEIFEMPAAPAASLRSDVQEKPKTAEKEAFTAWGKDVGGLQAGLGFKAGERRVYSHGETVRLVVRVRNVSQEEVEFQYLRQFFIENPPTVTDAKDKPVSLGRVDAFGEHVPLEVKLAPGKEIELYELELDLGSGNEAGIVVPKYPTIYGTGKFQIQYEKVLANSSSGSIKLDRTLEKLATGKLELEVKVSEKMVPEKETPTVPPNAAAAPAKPKPNYVTVVGQLIDDETGQPIEKAGWEWGMADPKKPDQISWGHSRSMGNSHPGGKFEMLVHISSIGNHYPLRVYSAGYETTVVVGELAKPYPEKIERTVRLKRGRSITGVLRDHTGKPVANGWVFFIPKGLQTNIVEGISGTDAHQLPVTARDAAVAEVRTDENGTFALPTGVAGTLAASTDLVDLWPFPLPVDGHAELKMPAPSYLVIDLTYWYLDELAKKGKRELSPNSEDPNQCWIQVDHGGSTEPLWKNLGYRRQMLVFAKDPRAKLSKGVIVGHVVEWEMDQPIPDVGHNKNLSTKVRVALPPGNYRVQRLRAGPFTPVDEQNVELKSGEDTTLSWARGDGSSVRGKATWPANMMFVRQPGEAARKLDWTLPFTATVRIAPVGADGKDGKPIEAAQIQADGSFFIATNLDPGKYKATARVSLPESDDSRRRLGWRGPDCDDSQEFTVPEPARGPSGSPPVEVEIKMSVPENVRFLRAEAPADPPKAVQPSAEKEKEAFTAWGKEISGLQAGLGFLPGEQRVYSHGETVRLVVRVRNVGREEVEFQYLRQYFVENPPTVMDDERKSVSFERVTAFGVHGHVKVKLAPGKEIELYELKLDLESGNEAGVGGPSYSTILGTGKFQIQYEKVFGNSSSGSIKLDPALSKLATGKLELEIQPVAPVQQEAPKPNSGAVFKPAT